MVIPYTPEDITLKEVAAGEDRLILITGGKAHIGAVSTAYLSSDRIQVQTQQIPGHKEYVLTEELAMKGVKMLGNTVTVAAGIHYDQLTKAEINAIVEIVHDLFDKYLASVRADR